MYPNLDASGTVKTPDFYLDFLGWLFAKNVDFFADVIYNTLMKQSFVIAVDYSAATQERGEDTSLGLCL
jgi:hypothetical protein